MTATTIAPQFFICIRRPERPGPRLYPVVKLPDGTLTETTWQEYRRHVPLPELN